MGLAEVLEEWDPEDEAERLLRDRLTSFAALSPRLTPAVIVEAALSNFLTAAEVEYLDSTAGDGS